MRVSPSRARILHEIVRISHANGVSVLAEGVETAAQHENLLAADVDMFQGYLFGGAGALPAGGVGCTSGGKLSLAYFFRDEAAIRADMRGGRVCAMHNQRKGPIGCDHFAAFY